MGHGVTNITYEIVSTITCVGGDSSNNLFLTILATNNDIQL